MDADIDCKLENKGMPIKWLHIFLIKYVRLFAKIIKRGKAKRGVRCLRKGKSV